MGTLRLTLMRHGTAEPIEGAAQDYLRELTSRGRGEASGIGERLARAGLVPDLVLASSARRTRTTAALLGVACALREAQIRHLDALYNATADAIWQLAIAHADGARHLLLCGHNPGISQLGSRLAAGASALPRRLDLPPAGLLTVSWPGDDWRALDADSAQDGQLLLP